MSLKQSLIHLSPGHPILPENVSNPFAKPIKDEIQ